VGTFAQASSKTRPFYVEDGVVSGAGYAASSPAIGQAPPGTIMKATLLALLFLSGGALAAEPAAPAMPSHVMTRASEITWGDPPPFFEHGAQFALVAGDPGTAGNLFVVRLKMPAGYRIARHWHPGDEHVTVLEGSLTLAMGEGGKVHTATFGPGDYVLLPARMQHEASTTDGAVVQVHGMGPFAINYVDPKDDPRNRAADAGKSK
jgi:quercetin dioxygenase-like cupin family protein